MVQDLVVKWTAALAKLESNMVSSYYHRDFYDCYRIPAHVVKIFLIAQLDVLLCVFFSCVICEICK